MKLLAIDDNQDNLTTLKAVLRDALPGCVVSTALNGPRGMELAHAEDPDVILLDIVMPGMDGFEVCQRLKADRLLCSIPVVFLTALRTDRESRVKALEAGAEAFLSKPWDEHELVAQIRAMTKVKAANRLQRMEKEELAALVAERTAELEQQLAERKRTEDALSFLAHTSSEHADEPFFRALARYLAESLGMDFVCIDRLEGDGLTARTVAVWCDGHFEDNVTYALKDTPCGEVVGKAVCCYPASVRQFFPRDQVLQELRAESYVGVTLWGYAGQPIGLIAVIGHGPLANRAQAEATLKLVAGRAAGELERFEHERALRESETRFREMFDDAPIGYHELDAEGRIIRVNRTELALLGYSAGEMLGRHVWEFVEDGELSHRAVLDKLAGILPSGQSIERTYRRKDGTGVPLLIQDRILLDREGKTIGIRTTVQDISERKLAEELIARRIVALTRPLEGSAVAFADLFRLEDIQRLQDEFAVATGVASIITHPDGTPLTAPSNFTRLCSEIIRPTERGCANCFRSDAAIGRFHPEGPIVQQCLSGGLWDAGASITVGGHHVANWLIGQVRDETQTEETMRDYARTIGADERVFMEAFWTVPAMSRKRFEQIAQVLFSIATQLSISAYQNIQQARFITERKQVEEERAQAHGLLTNLARLVPGVVYQYRLFPDGRSAFPYASPGMNDIYEVTPEEVQHDATPVFGRIHPDDFERVGTAIQESARTLQTFHCKFRVILPRQGLRWRWSQAQPERTEDGGTLWYGVISDITELRKAEMALVTTAELLERTAEIAMVGGWDLDLRTMELSWSLETSRIHEVDPPVAPALDQAINFYSPEARPTIQAAVQAASEHGTPFDLELPLITAKGRRVWVRAQCSPVMEDGKVTKLHGAFQDITARKQAEEQLRRQATLLDSANDAIYVRALDHTITYWNGGAERLYGLSSQQVLGRKITELGGKDQAAFNAAHVKLLAEGSWTGDLRKPNHDGKERVISCRWTLLRDEQGQPKEVLAINTDVTEQKQLEAQLLRAQRMEGIGMLAGGIAHDLNNILTPVMMSVPLLREAVHDDENRQLLDTVQSSAQRGADIIRQLLTFARGQPGVRAPVPVRQLLREMEKLIRETFPRNLSLAVTVPPELWLVVGDATQIHQALMNLCLNARDAMPDGGTLTLAADNFTLDAASAALMSDAKPGPHVRLCVSDTGTGIPPAHLERIFDPFFTTKEIGKGTGLGLPTVLGIVRGHGGSVRVNSRVGQGSTFELYLPASLGAKASDMPEREVKLPRGHGELILVVDDEATVRGPAQAVLERYGYRVLVAVEGAAALVLFALHRTEIKAVLTDMMMPGMDGPKLIRALRQLDARLPILGMTGLIERGTFKGLEGLDSVPLLAKPFELENLLVALHQTLTTGKLTTGSAE